MKSLLLASLILAPLGSPAADCVARFDFNGMHFGDSIGPDRTRCRAMDNRVQRCVRYIHAGGFEIETQAFFLDEKFAAFNFNFPSAAFETIVEAYKVKLGCDPVSIEVPIQNTLGAEYKNTLATWATIDGALFVERLGSDLRIGDGTIGTREYDLYLKQRDESKASGLAGTL